MAISATTSEDSWFNALISVSKQRDDNDDAVIHDEDIESWIEDEKRSEKAPYEYQRKETDIPENSASKLGYYGNFWSTITPSLMAPFRRTDIPSKLNLLTDKNNFFKRKRRPSLSNVVDIHLHHSVSTSNEEDSVLGSDSAAESVASDNQNSWLTESRSDLVSENENSSLVLVPKTLHSKDTNALSSICDLRGSPKNFQSSPAMIESRSASLLKWSSEKLYLNSIYLADGEKNVVGDCGKDYKWIRRRTFTSLPEYDDIISVGVITGRYPEKKIILLTRSAPISNSNSTPPTCRSSKTNSVPLLSPPQRTSPTLTRSRNTASAGKLSKWSKSKIDLLVPSLRSLVTMTTKKLSSNKARNLNCSRKNDCVEACSLRRNISLNDLGITSDLATDRVKTVSSDNVAAIGHCSLSKEVSHRCYADTRNTQSTNTVRLEPLTPVNRLRVCPVSHESIPPSAIICTQCSSLYSMASSKYSSNLSSAFVSSNDPSVLCKVCLTQVSIKDSWILQRCDCSYCVDCVRSYVEFEINQGAYNISCPDTRCANEGVIMLEEIETLVSIECVEKYKRYRLNAEVAMDRSRTWCPQAGCETVCTLCFVNRCSPQSVHCPNCNTNFCSNCRTAWHPDDACKVDETIPGVPFNSELIKCCPMCSVPIEKVEGCAQMLCKRCKHVFCWYCLASLDDDFLLRHYDKGPCKNKLGHSRASVIWHRTQVISIFAGFGILLLIASPLLLLAAPCILCCKCRICSPESKLDVDDDMLESTNIPLNPGLSINEDAASSKLKDAK